MAERVLVTGATGLIGRRVVASLVREGAAVHALVRDPARAGVLLPGATLFPWDATAGEPPAAAFAGVDAVVNLAGESIARRWSASRKRALRASRIDGTRALVVALHAMPRPPTVLVQASAVGIYGDRGDEELGEDAAPGSGFLAELCRDWEAEAAAAAGFDVRVVLVRTGLVLAPEGGPLGKLVTPFRLGVGGRLGSGRQFMPWIHIVDQVGLVRLALGNGTVRGPLNAAAPGIVRNSDFTRALASALHRPALLPAPAAALRLVLGEMAGELLLSGQRVLPTRALAAGYQFRFPELRPALEDLLAAPRT